MRVLIEGAYTVLRVANSETDFPFILCRSRSSGKPLLRLQIDWEEGETYS